MILPDPWEPEITGDPFYLRGVGLICPCLNPFEWMSGFGQSPLLRTRVRVHGVVYRVVGIEGHAIIRQRKGAKIGLLLSEVESELR